MDVVYRYDNPNSENEKEAREVPRIQTGDRAVAEGSVVMNEAAFTAFVSGAGEGRSDAWTVARIAGIQGAKRADELILISYTYNINKIEMDYRVDNDSKKVTVVCEVTVTERVGAEAAALVGCSTALMSLVNSLRVVDREMRIDGLKVRRVQ